MDFLRAEDDLREFAPRHIALDKNAWTELQTALHNEKNGQKQLKSWPRLRVVGFAGALTALVLGMMAFGIPRPDLAVCDWPRLFMLFGVGGALIAAGILMRLRPMYKPLLSQWTAWVLGAGAILVALSGVFWPAHAGAAQLCHDSACWANELWNCGTCLRFGVFVSLPLVILLSVAEQRSKLSYYVAVPGYFAAGLLGFLALELHCPSPSVSHRLAAHAGVLVVCIIAAGIAPLRSFLLE